MGVRGGQLHRDDPQAAGADAGSTRGGWQYLWAL